MGPAEAEPTVSTVAEAADVSDWVPVQPAEIVVQLVFPDGQTYWIA